MKSILLFISLILLGAASFAQTTSVRLTSVTQYQKWWSITTVPNNLSQPTDLIVWVHGLSELGDTEAEARVNLYKNGSPLNYNLPWPVFSLMGARAAYVPITYSAIAYVLANDTLLKRVWNGKRIHFIGGSAGANEIAQLMRKFANVEWSYTLLSPTAVWNSTPIVPVGKVFQFFNGSNDAMSAPYIVQGMYDQTKAAGITAYLNINAFAGHAAWGTVLSPTYKLPQTGKNVYETAFGAATPPAPTVFANAGKDTSIVFPTDFVWLVGKGSPGAKLSWRVIGNSCRNATQHNDSLFIYPLYKESITVELTATLNGAVARDTVNVFAGYNGPYSLGTYQFGDLGKFEIFTTGEDAKLIRR